MRAPGRAAADFSAPSPASLRGLDWFTFFLANVQTGFGPFISIYLTTQKWTQTDIGLLLTIGGLVALAGQVPGGALVDAVASERPLAMISVAVIAASALILALWPIFPVVLLSQVLHSAASCVLGPAIAAISLGLVGHAAMSARLGRNACFASIGNGLSAAAMGASGYWISNQAVFFVTTALCVPTMIALSYIRERDVDPVKAHGGTPHDEGLTGLRGLLRNSALLIFASCAVLFHLANTAMLPLVGSIVTMRSSQLASALVAACIVIPQVLVAFGAPLVGRWAQTFGRRPLLLIGFAALPIRGILIAYTTDPYLLVMVQVLDGVSGAALGVLVPLVIADTTRGTGHFNLAQGLVGCAVGIGASLSTTLAGSVSDHLGSFSAFVTLAGVALAAFLIAYAFMPETRPDEPAAKG